MKRILVVLAAAGLMVGCNDSDSRSTTVNEAAEPGSGQTNGILIMQDGSGNIVSVYAETDTGMYPITIDQVGTGNLAIVEIVRPPVIPPEPVAP
jgi:hypothetical protein